MLDHYHVCLPQGILKALKKNEFDELTKKKFEKALLGLQDFPYPHSINVKRIKGLKRKIFEARIDIRERILFDYCSRFCKQ